MKKILQLFFLTGMVATTAFAQLKTTAGEYYQIIVYHFASDSQQRLIDNYLRDGWLPAAHKAGFKNIGVFKPLANDTAADKRVIVWVPAADLDKLIGLSQALQKFNIPSAAGDSFLKAPFDRPAFSRFETILLHAFRLAPKMQLPALNSPKADHVYELRSYESATMDLYDRKVTMFNEGGEIKLFKRLGFNAVFYADVISGSRMPNLMYLTSFENLQERDAHWKTFGADPEWKRLSGLPEYAHTVSKADIILMRAADYSDF